MSSTTRPARRWPPATATLGLLCAVVMSVPMSRSMSRPVQAEAITPPAACKALQAKYPDLKGKTLVNAVNPHTPGYEALDPKDPSKYIGFDIDLGETMAPASASR